MRFGLRFCSLVILGVCSSTSAMAKSNKGELTIQGFVPPVCQLRFFDFEKKISKPSPFSKESIESKIGTIHMYSNDEAFEGGKLYIESKNRGNLIAELDTTEALEEQKYQIKIQDNTFFPRENDDILPTTVIYDLSAPIMVNFQSDVALGMRLERIYDVHIVLPAIGDQVAGPYKDTITFTFMDEN